MPSKRSDEKQDHGTESGPADDALNGHVFSVALVRLYSSEPPLPPIVGTFAPF
jgi:hypothetical protein